MPRLINKPPRYSRHKSGQARVRFNGKTTYLGRYGSPESKEAYTRVLAQIPKPAEEFAPTRDPARADPPRGGSRS